MAMKACHMLLTYCHRSPFSLCGCVCVTTSCFWSFFTYVCFLSFAFTYAEGLLVLWIFMLAFFIFFQAYVLLGIILFHWPLCPTIWGGRLLAWTSHMCWYYFPFPPPRTDSLTVLWFITRLNGVWRKNINFYSRLQVICRILTVNCWI